MGQSGLPRNRQVVKWPAPGCIPLSWRFAGEVAPATTGVPVTTGEEERLVVTANEYANHLTNWPSTLSSMTIATFGRTPPKCGTAPAGDWPSHRPVAGPVTRVALPSSSGCEPLPNRVRFGFCDGPLLTRATKIKSDKIANNRPEVDFTIRCPVCESLFGLVSDSLLLRITSLPVPEIRQNRIFLIVKYDILSAS